MKPKHSRTHDRIARWMGFLALAALLAMATLPVSPHARTVAASNSLHWGTTWHG